MLIMVLYNDTWPWQGGLGSMLGLFLFWERNELTQAVFYLSLCLFTLNTLLSKYI